MDQYWEFKDWHCSATGQVKWSAPNKKEVENYRDNLIRATNDLADVPYNPCFWIKRSEILADLGYPELAAADAYKCIILVNASLLLGSGLGLKVRLQHGMQNWLLNQDHSLWDPNLPDDEVYILQERMDEYLISLRKAAYIILLSSMKTMVALPDMISICQEALDLYPKDELLLQILNVARFMFHGQQIPRMEASNKTLEEKRDGLYHGGIFARRYPWIGDEFRARSKNTIDSANHDLKQHSKVLTIQKSNVSGFGMFAKRAIKKDETMLLSTTPFGISYEQLDTDEQVATQCYNCYMKLDNQRITFSCCPQLKFCSADCKAVATAEYHTAICGKDFSGIYNHAQNNWGGKAKAGQKSHLGLAGFKNDVQSGKYPEPSAVIYPSSIPLMLLRFLAVCLQKGGHPLKNPAIEQLIPNQSEAVQLIDGKPVVMGWSFYAHVSGPIQVLQTLGVDVFADPRYDTWVIMTMWQRIKNNVSAGIDPPIPHQSIAPLYCWFNHSCIPSACLKHNPNSTTEVQATRDIAKGQEVYISYLGSPHILSDWKTRQKYLKNWIHGKCGCERCQVEEVYERIRDRA